MHFERKQQERTSSVIANRNSSELKTSHRRKRPRVSQDVLAFKMQSKINSKNDVGATSNVRVVNLGRGRSVPPAKNGVNLRSSRSVDRVYLPLSPMETPSALDLSYSPNSGVPRNPICHTGVIKNKSANIPFAGSTDGNSGSSVIDLFGVPVEKPVKTQKRASSDESKHKYCVNSDRVCRKTSCSTSADGLMPVTAEENLLRDYSANRSNTFLSDQLHTDNLHKDHLHMDHLREFHFTRPDIFTQHSLRHMPTTIGSDNETCFSEPLKNYTSSRSACEKWCNMADSVCNMRQDLRYSPSLVNFPSMERVLDTGFSVGRDSSSFQVNLVNSPQRQELARNAVNVSSNSSKGHHGFKPSFPTKECGVHDAGHSVRNDGFDHPLYADGSIPNDTEFYAEVPDKIETIPLISSPRSPLKPVFLPYHKHGYSPQNNVNIFEKPCMYSREKDSITVNQRTRDGHFCKENHEPTQIWNQERHEVDLYQRPSNTNKGCQMYLGSNINGAYTHTEYYPHRNNSNNTFSNACLEERQAIPRKDTFIISSGLDCSTNAKPTSHTRDNSCSQASSFGWCQTLPSDVKETGDARRKTSMVSTLNDNNGDQTSRLNRLPDSKIKETTLAMNSKPITSRGSHGLSRLLQSTTEDMSRGVPNQTVATNNENSTSSLPNTRLLSDPLMTSTPFNEQNRQHDSHQTLSPESLNQTIRLRRDKQTASNSTVLLEMSMLEKQQQVSLEGVSPGPALASCRRETDVPSLLHGGMHTYSPESTVNIGTNLTPSNVHPHMNALPVLPTTPGITNSANNLLASRHSETSLFNTPDTGIASNDTRQQSEQSNDFLAENPASNTHHKVMYPNRYDQNKDKVAHERSSDIQCGEGINAEVSTNNLTACLPSPNPKAGLEVCSHTAKPRDNTDHQISASAQTTPKIVKDVACSPIKELIEDSLQIELQAANSTNIHNSKVYCLRSRNKTGQPDIVKDAD